MSVSRCGAHCIPLQQQQHVYQPSASSSHARHNTKGVVGGAEKHSFLSSNTHFCKRLQVPHHHTLQSSPETQSSCTNGCEFVCLWVQIVRISTSLKGGSPQDAPAGQGTKANYGMPADVWAIGILTYELLIGGPAFEADTKYAPLTVGKNVKSIPEPLMQKPLAACMLECAICISLWRFVLKVSFILKVSFKQSVTSFSARVLYMPEIRPTGKIRNQTIW